MIYTENNIPEKDENSEFKRLKRLGVPEKDIVKANPSYTPQSINVIEQCLKAITKTGKKIARDVEAHTDYSVTIDRNLPIALYLHPQGEKEKTITVELSIYGDCIWRIEFGDDEQRQDNAFPYYFNSQRGLKQIQELLAVLRTYMLKDDALIVPNPEPYPIYDMDKQSEASANKKEQYCLSAIQSAVQNIPVDKKAVELKQKIINDVEAHTDFTAEKSNIGLKQAICFEIKGKLRKEVSIIIDNKGSGIVLAALYGERAFDIRKLSEMKQFTELMAILRTYLNK